MALHVVSARALALEMTRTTRHRSDMKRPAAPPALPAVPSPRQGIGRFAAGLVAIALAIAIVPAVSAAEAWQSYIERHALALQLRPEAAALDQVLEATTDARLLLLGEATHGTREYYEWRAAISRRLIENEALSFIAVEGDWIAIHRLNRYVKGYPESGDSAAEVLRQHDRWPEWMWANPVIVELAEWLRSWNDDRIEDERVGIYGVDVYGWGDSVVDLPRWLDDLEDGWGSRVAAATQALRATQGDNQRFFQALGAQHDLGLAELEATRARLSSKRDAWRDRDRKAYLQAKQQTSLILQAASHLTKTATRNPRSWNPRAENFYATAARLLDHYGADSRGVLWAHNTHVGDARHTPMAPHGLRTVGQDAREHLGEEETFIIGFASARGSLRAAVQWGAPGRAMDLPEAPQDTLDGLLAQAGHDALWLPLEPARGQPELERHLGHRAIGVVHDPRRPVRQQFVPSNIPMRYDAILFIDATNALGSL